MGHGVTSSYFRLWQLQTNKIFGWQPEIWLLQPLLFSEFGHQPLTIVIFLSQNEQWVTSLHWAMFTFEAEKRKKKPNLYWSDSPFEFFRFFFLFFIFLLVKMSNATFLTTFLIGKLHHMITWLTNIKKKGFLKISPNIVNNVINHNIVSIKHPSFCLIDTKFSLGLKFMFLKIFHFQNLTLHSLIFLLSLVWIFLSTLHGHPRGLKR